MPLRGSQAIAQDWLIPNRHKIPVCTHGKNVVIKHTYESIAQRLRTLELQLPNLRERYPDMDDRCDAFAELADQILRDAATVGDYTREYASATLESIQYQEDWL